MHISKKSSDLSNGTSKVLKNLLLQLQNEMSIPKGLGLIYEKFYEILNKTLTINGKLQSKSQEQLDLSLPVYKKYLGEKITTFLTSIQPFTDKPQIQAETTNQRPSSRQHKHLLKTPTKSQLKPSIKTPQKHDLKQLINTPQKNLILNQPQSYSKIVTLSPIVNQGSSSTANLVTKQFQRRTYCSKTQKEDSSASGAIFRSQIKRKTYHSKSRKDDTLGAININNLSFDCSFNQTMRLSQKKSFDDTFINDETAFDWIQPDEPTFGRSTSGKIKKRIKPSFQTSYLVNKSRFIVSEYHELEKEIEEKKLKQKNKECTKMFTTCH